MAGGLSRPVPQWGYYEVMVGAIFTATPTDLDGFGATPAAQIGDARHAAMADVLLGRGGGAGRIRQPRRRFGMAVFRRFRLADLAGVHTGATVAGQWARTEPLIGGGQRRRFGDGIARVTPWRWLMRWVVMLAVLWALGIAILSCFVQSRSDSMIANNPTLWHQVQSWFTLL